MELTPVLRRPVEPAPDQRPCSESVAASQIAKLETLAHNIDLSVRRIAKGEEITAAIDAAKASGAEGLNFSASPLFFTYRQLIMDRVAALRLPDL
jgi:hypothetical protein